MLVKNEIVFFFFLFHLKIMNIHMLVFKDDFSHTNLFQVYTLQKREK